MTWTECAVALYLWLVVMVAGGSCVTVLVAGGVVSW